VDKDLEIETNVASRWLSDVILHCADTYTDAGYELHVNDGAWWGDHASFWTYGYAAVNHEESYDWYDPDFNPYYHTTNDVIDYVDPDFTVDNVQVAVATLATLAGPVPPVTAAGTDAADNTAARIGTRLFSPATSGYVTGLAGRSRVRVGVFDVRGRRITELTVPLLDGQGEFFWNGMRDAGGRAPSGIYFFRLEDVPSAPAAKFVLLK
jgi:hypothetical protein